MRAKDAIKISIETADMIAQTYLADLTDEEMMRRPHQKCNHIKWQLGHLILSDHEMINGCWPGALPDLPHGFEQQYAKEQSTSDNADDFHSKSELMKWYKIQRESVLTKLDEISDADLEKEAPETIRSYAPSLGAAFCMIGIHWTMHSGQWAVIRRQLGREVLI